MKAQRQGVMSVRVLRRIGALFHELAEVYETLAAEEERTPEPAPKPPQPRRARAAQYVPDTLPSELDIARARAVLKKLGMD